MKQLENIELQLWEYLDGKSSNADHQRISSLIEQDGAWKQKYQELSALHNSLQKTETDHPSLRFTANVMDSISHVKIAERADKYRNHWLIRGIIAFFLITITGIVAYSLITTDWSSGDAGTIGKLNLNGLFNSSLLQAVMFMNVILALILLDKYLKKTRVKSRNLTL